MSDSLFEDFRTDLAARFNGDDYFDDITILIEHKANVDDEIKRVLAGTGNAAKNGKYGACVVVLPLTASVEYPNPSEPLFKLLPTCLVLENPKINQGANGTGKVAINIARRAAHLMHQYQAEGLAGPVIPERDTIVAYEDKDAPVAFEVRFACDEGDPDPVYRVGTPTISPAGGAVPQTVTLSCPTEGAIIYYTLDGSPPYKGGATVQVYSEPFEVSMACKLRVGAGKAGFIPSNTVFAKFI